MKKKVIAFVHTHWDREWYREFETFRLRLIEVFDNVIDMLTSNKLPVFYFDGQTSALEDYLELRPEKETIIRQLIAEKKLYIGPMYCSIDEFLSSESVMNKNLELGIKYSKEFGCSEFLGYFSDTFGHTANVIPIIKKHNINTAIVWRGCGEIPSEFTWQTDDKQHTINCINLVRGYFNDFFHIDIDIDKRTELIKSNLDKIAEYSGETLLMPIGGDHLGVPSNLLEIVEQVNKRLENYEIIIGSIFDYINNVKDRFAQHTHCGELRDCSKTFILQGSYSSRFDLKKMNIECTHLLEKTQRYAEYYKKDFVSSINYAYKLLLQNQAHDSIYGCSLDDVLQECVVRYKKIKQICNYLLYNPKTDSKSITNLGKDFCGSYAFSTTEKLDGYQLLKTDFGFDKTIMADTLRVPITEDWREVYTYLTEIDAKSGETVELKPTTNITDVFVTDNSIGNSNIFAQIDENSIVIGGYKLQFIDNIDNGDSYNEGVLADDNGKIGKILSSQILYQGNVRSAIKIEVDCNDILEIVIELDNYSKYLGFKINWNNSHTNHKLSVAIETESSICETYSEEMNQITRREFDPLYNIREKLPQTKGIEAKTNTAPMQRGVWANNIGVITKGITQYEISNSKLLIPILRSTGVLSNPQNPARTTPAGPPYPLEDLKQLGQNSVEFYAFLDKKDELKKGIEHIYNFIV